MRIEMGSENQLQKKPNEKIKKHQKTYPADCRKIAAVDSNKHEWD